MLGGRMAGRRKDQLMFNTTNNRLSIAMLAAALLAGAAQADIFINSDQVTIDGFNGTAAAAQFRMSNSSWDMALDNGLGTSKSANYISANLGNNNKLSDRTYAFTLTHLAGQGFSWELTDTGSGKTTTDSWGTFDVKPDGTVKSALNGLTPGASFNTLLVDARSTRSGSSMEFSRLAFNSGLSIADGSFVAGVLTPSTSGPGDAKGFWNQTLVSTTDLAKSNWSLTGLFHGQRIGGGDDDAVGFSVSMRNATVTIPAPGAFALLGVVGLLTRAGSRRSDRA